MHPSRIRDPRRASPFRPRPALIRRFALAAALAVVWPFTGRSAGDSPAFLRNIAPILAAKCVACHGPDKAKGGYRLDTYERLRRPGDSKANPIQPGDPAKSHLVQLLRASDADERMPQKDDPLPAGQIDLIERWIRAGATFDGPDPNLSFVALATRPPRSLPPARYVRPPPVLALAFSPDGAVLAASGRSEITLWDARSGELRQRWSPLPERIHGIAFSPDGRYAAAAGGAPGRSGELLLLTLSNLTVVGSARTLVTLPDVATAVRFSPDGARLAGGGADSALRVFAVETGRADWAAEAHADWVMDLAWSPDGHRLFTASRDKSARVFEARSGELEATYSGHGEPVFAGGFSADGETVWSAGRDKRLHRWAVKDAKMIARTNGFEGDILRLATWNDRVFSLCTDGHWREHRWKDKQLERVRSVPTGGDVPYALAVHGPTRRLATGDFLGEIRIWDLDSGTEQRRFTAAPGWSP